MPRPKRIAKGNVVYHVINRANGRLRIFKTPADFEAFEQVLAEGIEQFSMRLCGYCIMSNHWHLVLWPRADGDLSAFMKWITATHSHRWHGAHGTVGIGHLYQVNRSGSDTLFVNSRSFCSNFTMVTLRFNTISRVTH